MSLIDAVDTRFDRLTAKLEHEVNRLNAKIDHVEQSLTQRIEEVVAANNGVLLENIASIIEPMQTKA